MLTENPNNSFRMYGTVVRDPRTYRNRDGSMKVAMTIAVEDECPRPDGSRGFQHVPVETFYGRRYVEAYGDAVKDAVQKGDVVSARGRLEMHSWTAPDGSRQDRITLFCLDTPSVIEPANDAPGGAGPYVLHRAASDAANAGQHTAGHGDPDPPARVPDPIQAAGDPMTEPFVLNRIPAAPRPAAGPVQVPGDPSTEPFVLHRIPAAARPVPGPDPAQAAGGPVTEPFVLNRIASAQTPAPVQAPGSPSTEPFMLNRIASPAPAHAHAQVPGDASTEPFVLHRLPSMPAAAPVETPEAARDLLTGQDTGEKAAAPCPDGMDDMSDLPFTFGNTGPAAPAPPMAVSNPSTRPSDVPVQLGYVSGASMPIGADSALRAPSPAAPGPDAWSVKSHYRTLKSGKRVLVQGHMAHRLKS